MKNTGGSGAGSGGAAGGGGSASGASKTKRGRKKAKDKAEPGPEVREQIQAIDLLRCSQWLVLQHFILHQLPWRSGSDTRLSCGRCWVHSRWRSYKIVVVAGEVHSASQEK